MIWMCAAAHYSNISEEAHNSINFLLPKNFLVVKKFYIVQYNNFLPYIFLNICRCFVKKIMQLKGEFLEVLQW
jgi:hypothetical protein